MYRLTVVCAGWMMVSIPIWAQHSGHQAETGAAPVTSAPVHPGEELLTVRDAVGATQALFRELEKNMRRWDAKRVQDATARYAASVDTLVRSIDAASHDDRNYGKNLEFAVKSLDRQYQQLAKLVSTAPPEAVDSLNRLIDAVALARDEASSQQAALREGSAGVHDSKAHGGHGCGGMRGILRRIL